MRGQNMGIKCKKCGETFEGELHLTKKCPNEDCENTEKDMFERVPDEISEEEKEKDRKWLEEHEIQE